MIAVGERLVDGLDRRGEAKDVELAAAARRYLTVLRHGRAGLVS